MADWRAPNIEMGHRDADGTWWTHVPNVGWQRTSGPSQWLAKAKPLKGNTPPVAEDREDYSWADGDCHCRRCRSRWARAWRVVRWRLRRRTPAEWPW